MKTQVFAFAKIEDNDARKKVYQEIKNGKSRFGMWDQKKSLNEKWHGKNAILLRIKKGDWIVHVNMPKYGNCVAAKTVGEYDFDAGVECKWGYDFNNFIPIDKETIIEFDRNDPNIISSVNLAPRRRAQRVLQVADFLQSIDNLKTGVFDDIAKQDRAVTHLREKVSKILPEITVQIQRMNKSKEFERFLNRIFENMPNTVSIQNGSGWRSDNGADLIVEFQNPILGINLTTKIIVQAKSYSGKHIETSGVDQIVEGIKEYKADGGLLISTAKATEELENYIVNKSEEIDKTIDLIAGDDVAKFVLRYAPELLIGTT